MSFTSELAELAEICGLDRQDVIDFCDYDNQNKEICRSAIESLRVLNQSLDRLKSLRRSALSGTLVGIFTIATDMLSGTSFITPAIGACSAYLLKKDFDIEAKQKVRRESIEQVRDNMKGYIAIHKFFMAMMPE